MVGQWRALRRIGALPPPLIQEKTRALGPLLHVLVPSRKIRCAGRKFFSSGTFPVFFFFRCFCKNASVYYGGASTALQAGASRQVPAKCPPAPAYSPNACAVAILAQSPNPSSNLRHRNPDGTIYQVYNRSIGHTPTGVPAHASLHCQDFGYLPTLYLGT